MAAQNLLDEKHITNAIVYIEGEEMNIVSMHLEQEFGQHHKFRVTFDYDIIKKRFLESPLEQLSLIGKTLDIELQQGNDSGKAYEFRGIINNVYMEGKEGRHGHLIVEGYSPTYLLEKGKRLDVFSEMSLQEVFDEITDGLQSGALSKVNKPVYNIPLSFLMQYYESDWEFLQRLSAISGETLFYTGRELVFGEYKDWDPTDIMYDKELTQIQFGSRLLANTFSLYQYLTTKDDILTQQSPDKLENSEEYLNVAEEKSKNMVKERPVLIPSSLVIEDKGSLDDMVERRKSATAAHTVYIKAISKTCDPRIGRLISISMPQGMAESANLGTYRVVKVIHSIDENHHYNCEFEAIPSSLKFYPVQEVKTPVAHSLLGTVVNNADPESQGRVLVEFPFAKDRMSSTWMRVMTPNAGSSNIVDKNRGLVFIPEEGDQVMIGFEFGDPNRPYVMGSMFHGVNGAGGGDSNHIKSIITKEGHTIEFDDAEDTLGITIKDKNGNYIHIDTKGNNIEITALETITMKAKNINMDASENIAGYAGSNITMHADKNIESIAGEDYHVSSNNMYSQIISDSMHTAKKYEITADKVRIDSTQENMELASNKEVDVQSAKKVRLF